MAQTSKNQVQRVNDMTQGSPIKLILTFAIPLFIGIIFQQVYSMVDTMVVGYGLGDQAIAAIGATSSLYSLIVNFAWGLNSGYGIVVTQRFGAHDEKALKQSIAGMIVLDAAVTAVLTALSLIFLHPLMRFMNTPEAIFDQAHAYIVIIYAGMITTIGYNMFAGILRAMGNSRSPLYFLIISSLLNVVLDILLVLVIPMGVAGAAIATVIAQNVSAVLCGIYVFRNYGKYMPSREDYRVPKKMLGELFSTGFAMALMITVVDFGSAIFQRANNVFGEVIITSHAAARRIIEMFMSPLSTIATANSTFIGQNWGARKMDRIKATIKKVIGLEVAWAVFSAAAVYLFGSAMVQFITGTDDPDVIANAVMSIRLHFACYPALGILFCLRTSMQAMGQKIAPVISSCIELAMKFFAAAWLIPQFGFFGTSITEPVTWVLMMAFLAVVYFTQRKNMFALNEGGI